MDQAQAGQIRGNERTHRQRGASLQSLGEFAPVRVVHPACRYRDGRRQNLRRVPPTRGHKQNLPRAKLQLDARRLRKQRKFLQIRLFQIDLRLVAPRIQKRSLVWRKQRVLLDAINLAQKSVDVPGIEMQDGKFSARPADEQLKASAMQPRVKGPRQRSSEPIGMKIVRQRLQVGIELRKKLFDVHVAQVWRRIRLRRCE